VDDGSPDGCPAICDEYAARDSRFVVIHQENGGLSAARNAGIDQCSGDWIVFLDSDDKLCNVNGLYNLTKELQTSSCKVHYTAKIRRFNDDMEEIVYDRRFKKKQYDSLGLSKEIYTRNKAIIAAWCFIIRRDFLKCNNIYFIEGIFHEDIEWIPRVISYAGRISVSHFEFYAYRINRPFSIMSSNMIKKEFDKFGIIDNFIAYISNCGNNNAAIKIFGMAARSLWINIFLVNRGYVNTEDEKYKLLLDKLSDYYNLLTNYALDNYRVFFICVHIVGIQGMMKIINTIKKSHGNKNL